jgi:hypothetical protein
MHNESRADLITEANPDQLVRVPTLKEKVVNTALVGAIFVAPVALGVGGAILGWKQTKMNLEAAKMTLEAAKLNAQS